MCCNGIIVLLALIVGFGAIVYLLYQVYSYIKCGCGKYGPFVSSYGKIKDDIIDEARNILKKAKKPMRVTDLGCGSGVLLLPLAKEFPQHEFIGLEWDIVPLTMGKIKAHGLKNIKFVKGDYMKTSHSDMDLIMCYVLKVTGEPLGKKLAKEIKDDCIVISEMFPLGHLDEVKQIESSIYGVPEKIFVYKKPAKAVKKDTVKTTKKTATKKTTTAKKTVAKAKTTAEKTRTAKGKK
jgi:SAM-dependent methyltransferase